LLLGRLDGHETHGRPAHRFADREDAIQGCNVGGQVNKLDRDCRRQWLTGVPKTCSGHYGQYHQANRACSPNNAKQLLMR
jgi:hypothetical protein